ncbi:Transmembrane protein, partial [Globisporangium splendens]
MALFPPEFIAGLLAAFFQFRLRAYFSVASVLVNGLTFFLPPDDALIATLNGDKAPSASNATSSKKTNAKSASGTPLSAEDKMQAFYIKVATTEHGVFQQTLFYELYEMLVIVVTSTLVACFVGDVVSFAKPWFFTASSADAAIESSGSYRPEISVYGLVSALLVALWFPLQIKFAQGLETYEARLGIGIGFLGFVLALFVIFAPKQWFDFDVESAADAVGVRLEIVLRTLGFVDEDMDNVTHIGDMARMALFGQMALLAGVFACTSFLPAFRFARMYAEMTRDAQTSKFQKLLLHINMLSSLLLAVCWINALSRDVLVPSYLVKCGPRALTRDCFATPDDEARFAVSKIALKESQFDTLRIYLVLFSVLVRIVCFRGHLQYFLVEIKDTIIALVRRPGRVDGALLQSKIRIQFNYLPIIAVQYLAPVASLLASAVLLARQTATSFGVMDTLLAVLVRVVGLTPPPSLASGTTAMNALELLPDTTPPDFGKWQLGEPIQQEKLAAFVKGMAQFTVVPPSFHASFFGFFLWWISFTWFAVSVAGLIYWHNVPHYVADGNESDAFKRNKQTPKLLKNQLKSLKMKKH